MDSTANSSRFLWNKKAKGELPKFTFMSMYEFKSYPLKEYYINHSSGSPFLFKEIYPLPHEIENGSLVIMRKRRDR
jgi:hypothetical protein